MVEQTSDIDVLMQELGEIKTFVTERVEKGLEPANEAYKPIYSDNCRINAVVLGLIRKF